MGCNCGKSTNKKVLYEYTFHAKGIVKTYRTEVEARAAVIRNGGGTITTRAA